jgi:hypothetical protein
MQSCSSQAPERPGRRSSAYPCGRFGAMQHLASAGHVQVVRLHAYTNRVHCILMPGSASTCLAHTSIPRIRGPVTGAYYSCADERARRSLWLCALGVSPSRSTYPWCARQRVQTEVRVLGFANTLCQLWTRFLTPARQPCAKICLALFAHLELVDAVRDTRALHASFAVDPRAHSHVYSKACPCQKLHMRP